MITSRCCLPYKISQAGCCSMSTFNKPKSCGNYGESVDGSYSFVLDHELCKCDSASLDLVRDRKWCLNHHGSENGYSHDQLNVFETDAKLLSASYIDGNSKVIGENLVIETYCTAHSSNDATFCSNKPLKHFYCHDKTDEDSWLRELESITEDGLQRTTLSKDMEEGWLSNARMMNLNSGSCPVFEQPKNHCSDLDSQWIGLKKIDEPWWHSAEKDDLASLVSRRSSSRVRSCDLPEPQSLHFEKGSDDFTNCFDQVKEQMSNNKTKISNVVDCAQGNLATVKDTKGSYADCTRGNYASIRMDESPGKLGLTEFKVQCSDGTISSNGGYNTAKMNLLDTHEPTSSDLSKSQLLEALCHSQTRAREAEKLAQEAYGEKDHVIDLFLRQASCLFAYRQWLRILQIETLCHQLLCENRPSTSNSPALSSIMCGRRILLRKHRCRFAKKQGKQRCNLSKCTVAFAIGLGLAGAGLLVGWNIGWLLPAF